MQLGDGLELLAGNYRSPTCNHLAYSRYELYISLCSLRPERSEKNLHGDGLSLHSLHIYQPVERIVVNGRRGLDSSWTSVPSILPNLGQHPSYRVFVTISMSRSAVSDASELNVSSSCLADTGSIS